MSDSRPLLQTDIEQLCLNAKRAALLLAQLSSAQKKQLLISMADCVAEDAASIFSINQAEVAIAKSAEISGAFLDRLTLSQERLHAMIEGIRTIAALPDPVGRTLSAWRVDSGLEILRVAMPLGVIAIIYESRPNVTADAAALCFYSGNAVILRGGSECAKTNHAITQSLQRALQQHAAPVAAIQMLASQDRSAVDMLLQQDHLIDVLIPRGGPQLIRHITENSRIPVFSHLQGLCHTYIHCEANLDMAVAVALNAKMRRPGICGATETLLVDAAIAEKFLPSLVPALLDAGCIIKGDQASQQIDSRIVAATEEDWSTEYLDAILSVRIVSDINQAIAHIHRYGSNHTEAIITAEQAAADQFCSEVSSAIVMHNCSTQFADGGEFGMGAEIGIATGKLHARGPVGVEQLTTFKYVVKGQGQTRP